MKIVVIGRASWLLKAAELLVGSGETVAAVITAKPSGEAAVGPEDYERLARSWQASFFRSINASREDILCEIAGTRPDLCLTMNFPGLLLSEFVSLFPLGVVNCHGSLLPKYRGNSPPNWAILNGDTEAGCTFHLVKAGELDTGQVLLQKRRPLDDTTYIGDIYSWFDEIIPGGFVEVVEGLRCGSISAVDQDEGQATESFPRRPADGRIDFAKSTLEISRLVRACSRPFPGAYCFSDANTKVTVWRASPISLPGPTYAVPGQVLRLAGAGLPVIKTGDGAIGLDEWQAAGDVVLNRRARLH